MSGYSAVYLAAAAVFFATWAFSAATTGSPPFFAMFMGLMSVLNAARLWRK